MSRDPLRTLARLRRFEVNEARRDLADRLRAEAAAEVSHRQALAAIQQEGEAATATPNPDLAAALFSTWLPQGMAAVARADAAYRAAELATERAQMSLSATRTAARVVETLRDEQAQARRDEALRKEQAVLDEHGQRANRDGPGRTGP